MEIQNDCEIIYILENDAMPGFLKIGRTRNLQQRIADLSANSSIPLPFRCTYAATVDDALFVEQQIHAAFSVHRVSARREFFKLPPECVIAAIELVAIDNVTPGYGACEEDDIETIPRSRPQSVLRAQAEADVIAMLSVDPMLPSQSTLGAKWGVTKGCVTKWLDGLATKKIIERHHVGRHVLNVRYGVRLDELENGAKPPEDVS